jgi:nucleotide-binding universal stress UspA family protein
MFKKVVWATDGSELAERALPFALGLASGDVAELIAVHVKELLVGRAGGYPLRADEPEIERQLETSVAELRERGVPARLVVITTGGAGTAASIAEAADAYGADVIVVGTHGRGAIAGTVLGSVARQLLHKAHQPVLAVPVLHLAETVLEQPVGAGSP